MKQATTLQVRAIMHSFNVAGHAMYTNKTTGHTGRQRRVKCYGNDLVLIAALQKACGAANVKQTPGSNYRSGPGITVKCVLA
jgi:hypothetical protein